MDSPLCIGLEQRAKTFLWNQHAFTTSASPYSNSCHTSDSQTGIGGSSVCHLSLAPPAHTLRAHGDVTVRMRPAFDALF